jgi:serine/threonine-protein phosphatase 6 regulatory ankyrin repeat subunit B
MGDYIGQNNDDGVLTGDQIVEERVPTREEINIECGPTGTRLMFEVKKGNKKNVELLLKQGQDVNAKDKKNVCALILAALTHHTIDIPKLLLDHGANINNICFERWSPLMYASAELSLPVIELFLDHNADINQTGKGCITSIMLASFYGSKVIVQLLMSRGANIRKIDVDGYTAIMTASQQGYIEIADVLEKWPATMAIILLQELHCYNLFDMSYLYDLIEFLGDEYDYMDPLNYEHVN